MLKLLTDYPHLTRSIVFFYGFNVLLKSLDNKPFILLSKKLPENQFYNPMKRILSIPIEHIDEDMKKTYLYIEKFIERYDRIIKPT